MYIKYEAKNELIKITGYDNTGALIDKLPVSKISIFNKVNETYYLIKDYTVVDYITEFNFDSSLLIDKEKVYIDIYINNTLYKNKVPIDYINTLQRLYYSLSYSTNIGSRLSNTSFLKRTTLGLPKWSTAYKEDISNYSKLFYPIFYIAERNFYSVQQALEDNLQNKSRNNYIYTKKPVGIVSINNKNIPITHIRDKEMITSITKTELPLTNINIFNSNYKLLNLPVMLDKVFNKLFVQTSKSTILRIEGTNSKRLPISESIFCDGITYTCTFNEYRSITNISILNMSGDEEPDIICTNYLNLTKDQTNFRKNYKNSIAFNKEKELSLPLYIYNNDTNTINSFYSNKWSQNSDFEDSYYCPDLKDNKGLFITDDQDIVSIVPTYLSKEDKDLLYLENDGQLGLEDYTYKIVTSQIRKNINTQLEIFSSNNNNSIVSMTDDNVMEDNVVQFEIDLRSFIDNFGNNEVYIYLEVDGVRYYLNNSGEFQEQKTTMLISNKNPIYISYGTENISYMTLVLQYNELNFQASCVKNLLITEDANMVSNKLYHNGSNLISLYNNTYYKLDLNKDYAELINDNTVNIQTDNKVTIINKEGNKDGYSINN